MSFRAGFVAIIGKPNVGKSTLLNALVRRKIAIATPKPQTTRDNIRGILTLDDAQIIFVDTPGIHKGKQKLNQAMVQRAYDAVADVDLLLVLVDASKGINRADLAIIDSIKESKKPKFLIVNKVDKINKGDLLEFLMDVDTEMFDEIIPVSALQSRNIDELIETIKKYLPEDVQYYPAEMVSDYPESFLISEIIREKILMNTEEEVPHSIAVVIEEITNRKTVIYIRALIVVEKQSQKGIVIGRNGQMLKKIATEAREELETHLGSKVFLETFVRVQENWRDRKSQLQQLGYWDNGQNE
ncbi:MAG: GTPase Era [Erysipelotrichaceae bacterium]|nr:GTPase Era [Erysipelotrichaceae bacterium]MBQ7223623.1 GTPase Era [Erysipelotrichaceae bacterium]